MPSPPAEQIDAVRQITLAQDASRAALTASLSDYAAKAVTGFDGWYSTAEITAWSAEVAKRAEAVQTALARQVDAYLARLASTITGKWTRPVGAVPVAGLRQGVTHAGAYARAADAYRWQQSRIDQFADILITTEGDAITPPDLITPEQAAIERVQSVADMDTQLAVRAQAQAVMTRHAETPARQERTVTGYRRVIHPELSTGGTCGLCIVASHRLYGPKEPMPVHEKCNCVPMPVYDHVDFGAIINDADLNRFYADAGTNKAAHLKATRYQIDDHGELGAVLVPQRRIPKRHAEARPRPAKTPAAKRDVIEKLYAKQQRAAVRAQELADKNPALWGDYARQVIARARDLQRQLAATPST